MADTLAGPNPIVCSKRPEIRLMWIPQEFALDPNLLVLYINDLPSSVISDSVFIHANHTTVFCTGDTVDWAILRSMLICPHSTKQILNL